MVRARTPRSLQLCGFSKDMLMLQEKAEITGLLSFTANFNSKHVILQFITKFCWGVEGSGGFLRALHKPYMLIKQHIKFLTAARKIANFLS